MEFLTYLVEKAYGDETFTDIYNTIWEEVRSFWPGDKTAEETARIMQNRVQLDLDQWHKQHFSKLESNTHAYMDIFLITRGNQRILCPCRQRIL